jgi:hypothetical protein
MMRIRFGASARRRALAAVVLMFRGGVIGLDFDAITTILYTGGRGPQPDNCRK